ncbi:DUF1707 domain-containing protein [uncultured Dietzia sp.]|uniref:DUF1707 SHOCT-like domain-containing protein n=1 Tax=uncultured Dietzia sp. TaxID=395519 RepID=UPI0025D371AB|nr:DUF1707 domain-containing protein [uncultured Dietzia sp.]
MAKHRNRASDAQRTAVQQALDEAFAAGRLDHFEHFERIRTATKSKYIDELRPLVADLRGGDDDLGLDGDDDDNAPAGSAYTGWDARRREDLSHAKRGWTIGIAVAVAVLAIAGGAIAASVSNGSSNAGTDEVGPGLLHTENGVTRLLAETESEFPAQEIDSILIYGEYATLSQQDPADPHKRITHEFRGGWEERRFDPIQADADLTVSSIDAADVMAAITAATGVLELDPDKTVISHVQVSADALGDPEFRVSASEGKYGDLGTATFGPAAQVREVTLPD